MINKHETIGVNVYRHDEGVTTYLKTAKNTVELHSLGHDINVATKTGEQMQSFVYYSVRLRTSDSELYMQYI